MDSTELKNMLIARIRQIDDIAFLKAIKTITDAKTEKASHTSSSKRKDSWQTATATTAKSAKGYLRLPNEDYFDEMEQYLQDS